MADSEQIWYEASVRLRLNQVFYPKIFLSETTGPNALRLILGLLEHRDVKLCTAWRLALGKGGGIRGRPPVFA